MLVLEHGHSLMAVALLLIEEQVIILWMSMKVVSRAINAVRRVVVRKETRLEMVLILDLTLVVLDNP